MRWWLYWATNYILFCYGSLPSWEAFYWSLYNEERQPLWSPFFLLVYTAFLLRGIYWLAQEITYAGLITLDGITIRHGGAPLLHLCGSAHGCAGWPLHRHCCLRGCKPWAPTVRYSGRCAWLMTPPGGWIGYHHL